MTQPIRITVDSSGPNATGQLAGCGVSPSTIDFDGQIHNFTTSPGCTVRVYVPADGVYGRYRFGSRSSLSIRTCQVGHCATASRTVFLELNNTYSATSANALGEPFGANMTFTVTGAVGSSLRSTVCKIRVLSSVPDTGASCWGWADYGRPTTLPLGPSHQPSGIRWQAGGLRRFIDTSGNNTDSVFYFKQVLKRVSFSIPKPTGGGYLPPVLSLVSLGKPVNYTLSTTPRTVWADYGSSWTIGGPLLGSTNSERWCAHAGPAPGPGGCSVSGNATRPGAIRPVYFHQFNDTFAFSVSDSSVPGAPSVTYRQFGARLTSNATRLGVSAWVDSGTVVAYQRTLSNSTFTERWATASPFRWSLPKATFNPIFYHQFSISFRYFTIDSSAITTGTPLGYYYQFGSSQGHLMVSNGTKGVLPASAWVDSGVGRLAYFTKDTAASGAERWEMSLPTSWAARTVVFANITTSQSYTVAYFHKFSLTYSYTLEGLNGLGGGSPSPPVWACISRGQVTNRSTLTTSPTKYWCDSGGSWIVYPAVLWGSNLSERWQTTQTLSGGVNGPLSSVFPYYHQYLMGFAFSIAPEQSSILQLLRSSSLGTGQQINPHGQVSPAVSYSQFGKTMNINATLAGVSVWVDAGSSFVYANPIQGSTATERWASQGMVLSIVLRPILVNITYYHQFLETFGYNVGNGSPAPPLVSYTSFGLPGVTQTASSSSSSMAWVDSQTTVSYSPTITDGMRTWTTPTPSFTAAISTVFNPGYL